MRALIISVNYYSETYLCELVKDIKSLSFSNEIETVVMDNGSDENRMLLAKTIENLGSNFSFVQSHGNLGYFGAAQLAWKRYASTHDLPDYIILANPDIRITDKEFWSKLKSKGEQNIFVIAPNILTIPAQHALNPHILKRPTRQQMRLRKFILGNIIFSLFWHWLAYFRTFFNRKKGTISNASTIYAAHGSFLIFTRRYFTSGGDFRHGGFLFGEEFTVAEFVRSKRGQIAFDPSLEVFHDEHATTGRRVPSMQILRYIAQSIKFVTNEYF